MKITEALLAEHAVFHNLFDYTERTVPKLKAVGEVRSLARLMESLLAAHSRTEEELLVQPLEHCLEQIGQCETFHQEHEEIDHNLKQAQVVKNLKQARLCLLAAVASSVRRGSVGRRKTDHAQRASIHGHRGRGARVHWTPVSRDQFRSVGADHDDGPAPHESAREP